jgi:hypothetical protein
MKGQSRSGTFEAAEGEENDRNSRQGQLAIWSNSNCGTGRLQHYSPSVGTELALKLMFKPFKNILTDRPTVVDLCIETQLEPNTVFKILR